MASEGSGTAFSEASLDANSMQGAYDVASGGLSVLEMGSLMSSSDEDALMMDRPFLDFINEMLMDEAMEEYPPLPQQDHLSYQAIVSGDRSASVSCTEGGGVSDISGESFLPLQSSSDSRSGSIHGQSVQAHSPTNSICNLTNEHSALVQSSMPGENGSFYDISPEQAMLAFRSTLPNALTNNSYSSDEQLYRLESPDIGNSFYNINSPSPLIQSLGNSDLLNAFTRISDGGNEFARPDLCDSPNIEYGWIDHVINSSPATPVLAALDNSSDGHNLLAERPSNGHVSFVKNKDLDVEADYERLYVDNKDKHHYDGKVQNGLVEDSRLNGRANSKGLNGPAYEKAGNRHVNANGKKGAVPESMSGKQKGKRNGKPDVYVSLDSKDLLLSCAQAVAVGDVRRAEDILQQLWTSGASANGNGLHRTLHYFCKALEARMHGTGYRLYHAAVYENRPSTADHLKAYKLAFGFVPLSKIPHYFANKSILKAAEGATHLHIIDYGIFSGFQWPCLINALADRKGGPPKLIITGIEFPQPGFNPAEGLEDVGCRLSEYAKTYKVPFEYHAIAASKWEDVNPILEDPPYGRKVLVINCINRLKNILDECVNASGSSTSSQREKLLDTMCNLKPDLFVVATVNATHSSPFFISRFRDALNYYSYKFDMMASTWVEESPERMIIERDHMYRDILNVVACEGVERVERPENYKQWQARFQRAGFEHVPVEPSVLSRTKCHVRNYYHKNFTVDHDSNRWILISWKGRPTQAMSAWKPRAS